MSEKRRDRRLGPQAEEDATKRELDASLQPLDQDPSAELLDTLTAAVVHDINNWLTVISGQSEHLLLNLGAVAKTRLTVLEIRTAAERASSLARELLVVGRRGARAPERLSLNIVVSEMEAALRSLIGKRNNLQLYLDPTLKHILGIRGQIERLILNLAANSRDAMTNGGVFTLVTRNVDAENVQISEESLPLGRPHVVLEASDTGDGIDPQLKRRVFEPFFTTKGRGRGVGLGLSSVRAIVDEAGGAIRVHAAPSGGTTFEIHLPAFVESDARDAPPTTPDPGRTSDAATIVLKGASGAEHEFDVVPMGAEFAESPTLFAITTVRSSAGRDPTCWPVYVGHLERFTGRLDGHPKAWCFENFGPVSLCVRREPDERRRRMIEADLIANYQPPCNRRAGDPDPEP